MNSDRGTSPAFLALSCIGFIASATGTSAVHAQSAPPGASDEKAVELQGVTVTDTAIDDTVKVDRVESPKATRPLLDTPQTISVIGNQTIRQQNLLTLKDALATIPGITFGAGEGGGGYGDSINLRGFAANSDITIDGVRDSAQYSRSETFNIEQIEVYNGANSVFNGSGSVGGTINIVQKRPKATDLTVLGAGIGTDDYYRATIDANKRIGDIVAVRLNAVYHRNDAPGREVERFRRWGVAPSVTIGVEGPTSLTFAYVHQHDDNIPQYGVPYYAVAGGLPAGVNRHGYYGYRNVDEQKSYLNQFTTIFEHAFSDKVSIRNLTRAQDIQQRTIVDPPQSGVICLPTNVTPTGTACTQALTGGGGTLTVPAGYYLPGGPRGNTRITRNQLAYTQTDLHAGFDTAGLEHTLVVGSSVIWEKFHLDTGNVERNANGTNPFGLAGPGQYYPLINLADPSSVIVGPAAPAGGAARIYGSNLYTGPLNYIRSGLTTGEQTSYAAYAFDTIKLGEHFELNGGARYEKITGFTQADTVATTGVVTSGLRFRNKDNLFSYRVGALFKPTPDTTLYVAYGNAKTPSKGNVNGACTAATCNVAPETAVNYEAGVKADLFDKRLQLTAAIFRNERSNYKLPSNDPQFPDQVLDGRSRVDGLALGASGNITPAWSIFANYTYLKSKLIRSVSRFCQANPGPISTTSGTPPVTTVTNPCGNSAAIRDPAAGNELVQTPKHSGSLFTTYLLPFGLQLGYGLTYQGSFALNNSALATPLAPTTALTRVFRSKDYLIHRLFASYTIREGLTAQVNLQNVTNEKYFSGIRNNGWANPGATRSATLSVFYSF